MIIRILLIIFTLATMAASLAYGQSAAIRPDVIETAIVGRNYVKNPSARLNTRGVSVSNATVTRDTDTADRLEGIASFVCDSSADGGYCEWDLDTIQEGDKTGTCIAAATYKGSAAGIYRLEVTDGTNVIASSLALDTQSDWTDIGPIWYPCGSPRKIRLTQNLSGTGAAINIGRVTWGKPSPTVPQIAQAVSLGSLQYLGATNCTWSGTFTSYAAFSADTDCASATVSGRASAPGTKIPGITFASIPPGKIHIIATGQFADMTADAVSCNWSLYDGTTYGGGQGSFASSTSSASPVIAGSFDYPSPQANVTFTIRAAAGDGSTSQQCDINNANANRALKFEVYYFPMNAQSVIAANQQRTPKVTHYLSGSGTHTWSNGVTHATIEIIGGGGGGGGAGTSATAGGAGGQSSFDGVNAPGGAGGSAGTTSGGNAGAATVVPCTTNESFTCRGGAPGGAGTVTDSAATTMHAPGGHGGQSRLGGAGMGQYETTGLAAQANTGSGGAGGPGDAATHRSGAGGSAGADITWYRVAPSGTASYTVGAAGAAGTGTRNGGAGGSGYIKVTEYFGYTTAILANSVRSLDYKEVTTINTIKTVAADYTATFLDETIEVDSSAAARTITLPPLASAKGKKFEIVPTSDTNRVIIDGDGSETICGQSTISLFGTHDKVTVQAGSTGWQLADGQCMRTVSGLFAGASRTASCSSSPCTIYQNKGNWMSGVTRINNGRYTIAINTGVFGASVEPECVFTSAYAAARVPYLNTTPTATSIDVYTNNMSGTDTDSALSFKCTGSR